MGVGRSLSHGKHSLFRGGKITDAGVHVAGVQREGFRMEVGHSRSDLGNQLPLRKCLQRLEGLRGKSLGRKWWELCWRDQQKALPCLQAPGGSIATNWDQGVITGTNPHASDGTWWGCPEQHETCL